MRTATGVQQVCKAVRYFWVMRGRLNRQITGASKVAVRDFATPMFMTEVSVDQANNASGVSGIDTWVVIDQ